MLYVHSSSGRIYYDFCYLVRWNFSFFIARFWRTVCLTQSTSLHDKWRLFFRCLTSLVPSLAVSKRCKKSLATFLSTFSWNHSRNFSVFWYTFLSVVFFAVWNYDINEVYFLARVVRNRHSYLTLQEFLSFSFLEVPSWTCNRRNLIGRHQQ